MPETPSIWQAPEILDQYKKIDHKIFVSARQAELLLIESNIDEDSLVGKRIVSVANGLSSFVPFCNSLGGGTECYGVDPVYGYIGEDYESFTSQLDKLQLAPHQQLDREAYDHFFTAENKRHLVAGDGTQMPFANESVDFVSIGYLLGYVADPELSSKILQEALRIIKPDGEIRVPDIHFVLEDGKLSFSYDQIFINENGRRFMQCITDAINLGASVYTARNLKPLGHQSPPIRDDLQQGKNILSYSTMVIRKDNTPPEITTMLPIELADRIALNPPTNLVQKITKEDSEGFAMESQTVEANFFVAGFDPKSRSFKVSKLQETSITNSDGSN